MFFASILSQDCVNKAEKSSVPAEVIVHLEVKALPVKLKGRIVKCIMRGMCIVRRR